MKDEKYKISRIGKDWYELPKAEKALKDFPQVSKKVLDHLVSRQIITMPPYWIDDRPYKKAIFYGHFKERLNYLINQKHKGLPIDDT